MIIFHKEIGPPTGCSSQKSDNKDHKDPLGLNKPSAKSLEISNLPPNALINITQYIKNNLE